MRCKKGGPPWPQQGRAGQQLTGEMKRTSPTLGVPIVIGSKSGGIEPGGGIGSWPFTF